MILSELDWRSKSVDIISRLPTGVTNTNGEQGTQLGVHVLSVQKLPNLADIEETVKRQVSCGANGGRSKLQLSVKLFLVGPI